ncbi:hypothetical protein ANCCAN_12342 [Ancylostoma caninum]|uniref:Uncharacterized protein n=1 Tax=Ancylostoma caninum TaxID=29170 RepID=A0A368GFY1_ANCCA|nr:hypothetical protein ANCCAN_12342 [Ancylostoma caninum]
MSNLCFSDLVQIGQERLYDDEPYLPRIRVFPKIDYDPDPLRIPIFRDSDDDYIYIRKRVKVPGRKKIRVRVPRVDLGELYLEVLFFAKSSERDERLARLLQYCQDVN